MLDDWGSSRGVGWAQRWGFSSPTAALARLDQMLGVVAPADAVEVAWAELAVTDQLAGPLAARLPRLRSGDVVTVSGLLLGVMRLQVPLLDVVRAGPNHHLAGLHESQIGEWTELLQARHNGETLRSIAARFGLNDAAAASCEVDGDLVAYARYSVGPARVHRVAMIDVDLARVWADAVSTTAPAAAVRIAIGLLARRHRVEGLRQAAMDATAGAKPR
jgi:hypothetical protein